jgi:predicted SprT family Zn-dependent metalloprotease
MDKNDIEQSVKNFCIESNTDIPTITYTKRRTKIIGSAYPHQWRINLNLVWFHTHDFKECFDIIKHEVLHLKSWWITGRSGHDFNYKMLCRKYNAPSNCVYKKKNEKTEIGFCALCLSIIYSGDNSVRHNGVLFCTESCKNEAIENQE